MRTGEQKAVKEWEPLYIKQRILICRPLSEYLSLKHFLTDSGKSLSLLDPGKYVDRLFTSWTKQGYGQPRVLWLSTKSGKAIVDCAWNDNAGGASHRGFPIRKGFLGRGRESWLTFLTRVVIGGNQSGAIIFQNPDILSVKEDRYEAFSKKDSQEQFQSFRLVYWNSFETIDLSSYRKSKNIWIF